MRKTVKGCMSLLCALTPNSSRFVEQRFSLTAPASVIYCDIIVCPVPAGFVLWRHRRAVLEIDRECEEERRAAAFSWRLVKEIVLVSVGIISSSHWTWICSPFPSQGMAWNTQSASELFDTSLTLRRSLMARFLPLPPRLKPCLRDPVGSVPLHSFTVLDLGVYHHVR